MRRWPALLLMLGGGAAQAGLFDTDERAALGAELRAYLLDHPQIIGDALSAAEARRYRNHAQDDLALLRRHAAELFDGPDDWQGGNPRGDVPLAVFVAYDCNSCARALSAAKELALTDPDLRLRVKDIASGENDTAARFAQAVLRLAGPEAYEQAQAALFATTDHAPARLDAIAQNLGLDPAQLRARMAQPDIAATLTANRALAASLDLGAPPVSVLPRTMIRGDLPAVALARIVAEMRRKK